MTRENRSPKFLIVRFSSIGDIVLTTPVIRNIKKSFPNTELHYLTKEPFKDLLLNNPNLDKVWSFTQNLSEVIHGLKNEKFSLVVDLHKNLRSFRLKNNLRVPSVSFRKLNVEKFLLTTFKKNFLPSEHIVDRYLSAVKELGVTNDGEGLDYHFSQNFRATNKTWKPFDEAHVVVVVGAAHKTKVPTAEKYAEIINKINQPIALIGGPKDLALAKNVAVLVHNQSLLQNYCGATSVDESALLIESAKLVITPDTGMMHIAAALKKPIVSLWGNTTPAFGMSPYYGNHKTPSLIAEVKNLPCRPCSKIGKNSCPKQHFMCMKNLNVTEIQQWVNQVL